MLDSLYFTLFRPSQPPRLAPTLIWGLGLLLALVLALNAAGRVGMGAGGVVGLAIAFLVAGLGAWFWLAASVHLVAKLLGGQGTAQATLAAIAQGFWPLLFTAPAIAIRLRLAPLGQLISLAIALWILLALIQNIRQIHQLSWGQAIFCLGLSLVLAGVALAGLLLWPLILLTGT